jgi:very-short-patch-repair endonuclease
MWQRLLSHRQFQGYKFHRQKPIGPYIVDFYCPDLRLVIEIDGDSHGQQADYDARRDATLHHLGLRVLRYTNRDVLSNPEGVFADLVDQIHETSS